MSTAGVIYPVDGLIGAFRDHGDSLFLQNREACHRLYERYTEIELDSVPYGRWLRFFRRISRRIESIPKVRVAWKKLVMDSLYSRPGPDWSPVIQYRNNKGRLRPNG